MGASLGIETNGGVFTKLIERNTPLPARTSEVFTTADDNQISIAIKVYHGDRELTKDNQFIAELHTVGIPPAPRHIPQIEGTFEVDTDGIATLRMKDLSTGKELKQINLSTGKELQQIKVG